MSIMNAKLAAAIAEAATAKEAHGRIALAVEEGSAGPAQLNAASKEIQNAESRIANLEAAMQAEAARDTERQAEAAAEAARVEQLALAAAVDKVNQIGNEWQAGVDALKALKGRFLDAVRAARVTYPSPDLNRRLQSESTTIEQIDEISRYRFRPL